ncbi:MAG: hypothetical protein CBB97_00415 [Candidatus Endolissoclinum sp. TMED37]|nr:MAG: hypothetical protein CBB97_00415 [Candidatus Endolissoclinum sp. TMED37]
MKKPVTNSVFNLEMVLLTIACSIAMVTFTYMANEALKWEEQMGISGMSSERILVRDELRNK